MKKRVYIAGPISKGDLTKNVQQSDEAFLALVKAGFSPLNPLWSVYAGAARPAPRFFPAGPPRLADGESLNDPNFTTAIGSRNSSLPLLAEDWYGIDLPWVEVAHAVLRLPGESRGADGEVVHAKAHGVPVFHSVEALVAHFKETT